MAVVPYRKQADTVSLLQTFAQPNNFVKMSRAFRGMVFSQDLSLISMGSDRALFKGLHGRLVAGQGDRIYLHGPDLGQVLSARVLELDVMLERFMLGEFTLTGHHWSERKHERVQPRRPIRVMMRCENCTLSAAMENISLTGLGLLAYKMAECGLFPRLGMPVSIEVELPLSRGRINLPGRLVSATYPGARLTCLGIQTTPNMEQARALERYITYRKAEIVDELEAMFTSVFEPRSVKELYF